MRCGTTLLQNQRGLSFVAVLVALLIAAALYFGYFRMQGAMSERSTGTTAIDAGRAVACRVNRQNVERNLVFWSVNHPGETPSLAALEADGFHIPSCPAGGDYDLVDGHVQCSVHR